MFSPRSIFLIFLAAAIILTPTAFLRTQSLRSADDAPLRVAAAYLRSVYAHDRLEAYKYISTTDKHRRDETSYVQSQPSYRGFALRLARQLASYGEIRLLSQDAGDARTHLEVSYDFPAMEDVADVAHNWDAAQLNSLSPERQAQILKSFASRNQAKSLVMVSGRESLNLIKEGNRWRVFFDWASSLRVQLDSAPVDSVTVRFAQSELFVNTDDPFQVNLTLQNMGAKPLRVTVVHNVEPKILADQITMIECGLSGPVTLDPGTEREFTMAYLLGPSAREIRNVKLTYTLRPESNRG